MTILNQEIIMITPTWATSLLVIFLISTITLFCISIDIPDSFLLVVLVAISTILLFISLFIVIIYEVPSGKTKYEVILDENYSAENLYSNYKVIEQRGKIWVLEDK